MTLLDDRDAEIVRLRRVDGLTLRSVAAAVKVSASTVHDVVQRFCDELAVFVGPLNHRTPEFLRDVTILVLQNADAVRAARKA